MKNSLHASLRATGLEGGFSPAAPAAGPAPHHYNNYHFPPVHTPEFWREPVREYPTSSQEIGNALVTPLRLRVSMGGGHLLSDGSPARLSLEHAIRKKIMYSNQTVKAIQQEYNVIAGRGRSRRLALPELAATGHNVHRSTVYANMECRLSEPRLTERPFIRTVVRAGQHPCPARVSLAPPALQFSCTCRDSFTCYCTHHTRQRPNGYEQKSKKGHSPAAPVDSPATRTPEDHGERPNLESRLPQLPDNSISYPELKIVVTKLLPTINGELACVIAWLTSNLSCYEDFIDTGRRSEQMIRRVISVKHRMAEVGVVGVEAGQDRARAGTTNGNTPPLITHNPHAKVLHCACHFNALVLYRKNI
ncbi:hypothetical protein EVAR_20971_1 [Eumeta japonica]|uniref:Uncharacterized protein n=1 Tax=Eumeta variegata TaxID=151549 RepID=A0A4C1V5R5_EUMVA|nr:hypothetical protein EVAR_20971_1 [Eumeta japonica]